MTDHDLLLANVVAAPDDDFPRLLFADWCEENGREGRAEFIRLQLVTAGNERAARRLTAASLARAYARQEELLGTDAAPTALSLAPAAYATSGRILIAPSGAEVDGTWHVELAYRRGFARAARLPMAAWEEHGRRLVSDYPLDRVVFADRSPLYDGGRYYWHERRAAGPTLSPSHVPAAVHAMMIRHGHGSDIVVRNSTLRTEEEAVAALSAAALAVARLPGPPPPA